MFNILTNVRGQIVGGLTALLMGGMSVFSFAQAGGHESVLKIIPHADLKNLDPIWTTAYISRNHGYMIYDTLFAMDESFTPQPQMVDTWTQSDDGMNWSFTLRDGLSWHDGSPVTAADCVASPVPLMLQPRASCHAQSPSSSGILSSSFCLPTPSSSPSSVAQQSAPSVMRAVHPSSPHKLQSTLPSTHDTYRALPFHKLL